MRALRTLVMVAAALLAVTCAVDDTSVLSGTASSVTSTTETETTTVPSETTSAPTATTSAPTSTPTPTTKTPATTVPSATTSTPTTTSPTSSTTSSTAQGTVAPSETTTSAPTSTPSATESSVAALDTEGGLGNSTNSGSGINTSSIVGVALGCLACVGAIVLIVTYKKSGSQEEQQTPPSSCAYADGNGFTPDNRSLDAILESDKPSNPSQDELDRRSIVPVLSMADLSTSAATAATRASSPFGLNSKGVRVSSPVRQYSSSSDDMVFATSSRRQPDSSEFVISMQALERESSASTVAAVEHGNGQVML